MVGSILNLCKGVRIYINYVTMILCTHMSHTNKYSYKELDQCMKYLYHHPKLPIIHPRTYFIKDPLHFIFQKLNFVITYINDLINMDNIIIMVYPGI